MYSTGAAIVRKRRYGNMDEQGITTLIFLRFAIVVWTRAHSLDYVQYKNSIPIRCITWFGFLVEYI